jgi:hypothetical protein
MSSSGRDFDQVAAAWDENPGRVKVAKHIAQAIARGPADIRLHLSADIVPPTPNLPTCPESGVHSPNISNSPATR